MTTSMQAIQFSRLTEALDTLFHDRHLIRGIRIDGAHGSDFTFKVYHARKDAAKGRNVILPLTHSFQQGLYNAVQEGYSRSSIDLADYDLAQDITAAGLAVHVGKGNSVILRPSAPQFSIPLVAVYDGHNIHTRPILSVGAPSISAAIQLAHLGNIEDALHHVNAQEPRVLVHTGEYPIAR